MATTDAMAPTGGRQGSGCPDCGGRRARASALRERVRRILRPVGAVLVWPLVLLVRAYQLLISPLTPPSCRYYPSCSSYALTSLRRFGPLKGTRLAVWRVLRCHPWAAGGVDHVPDAPHTCVCATAPTTSAHQSVSPQTSTDKDRR